MAIISPDPDLNTDSREYFTRHMRVLEKVMEAWDMSELQRQIDTVREAFSADVRKPFVLKPSFPYGSPHPGQASPPRVANQGYRPAVDRPLTMDHNMDGQHQQVSYTSRYPITPPLSAGTADSKSDTPAPQPLVMMSQAGQPHGMPQTLTLSEAPAWNPSRIFE